MVPERIDNLLVAGRCISTDRVALGSTRIMSTCMALGEAAGTAAMLSLHEEVAPRELDVNLLREQLRVRGAVVEALPMAERGPSLCREGPLRALRLDPPA